MQEDELIIFTQEELAQLFAPPPPSVYYIYYDKKTGNILSVTNERNDNFENYLEADNGVAAPFLNGTYKFSDFSVAFDAHQGLTIVPKEDDLFQRRTNIFEIIKPITANEPEFIVEWDKPHYGWNFYVNPNAKDRLKDEGLAQRIPVFITFANDLNILVRTINLEASALIFKEKIYIPFDFEIERDISKITISTKLVFETYGLRITHE